MDGDGTLTVHEFMAISSDTDIDTVNDEWAARRRDEFRSAIDLNHDNVATKEEIEVTKIFDNFLFIFCLSQKPTCWV